MCLVSLLCPRITTQSTSIPMIVLHQLSNIYFHVLPVTCVKNVAKPVV